jgi:hypothetical protein
MTGQRAESLQSFLALAQGAIAARVAPVSPAAKAMSKVAHALARPLPPRSPPSAPTPGTQPACRHLAAALAGARRGPPDLVPLADALEALAPRIAWRHRPSDDPVFTDGHANAAIVGSEAHALEQRSTVRIGLSLMAPGVTYPDHHHPPEEVYLVLSAGDWRQGAGSWHAPGLGGIVYNPPHIMHAMRSGPEPLLAIWCLPVGPRAA